MKNLFIVALLLVGKTFAQSTLLSPNSVKIPNLSVMPTCNVAAKGTQVFNTNDNKMYFCNGTAWTDMTTGGFTLPYSGNGSSTSPVHLFSLTNSGSGNTLYIENTGSARGIFIKSTGNRGGIKAETTSTTAIHGESDSGAGVYGFSSGGKGMYGISNSDYGVYAFSYNNFSATLDGRANVTTRLAIGYLSYAETIARLHIKADNNGGWGQHIRLENGNNTEYGEILHDSGGMKFRNFQSGESFIFRNSANTTITSINDTGDMSISGDLTSAGKGNVVSNTPTQQKIVRLTGSLSMTDKASGVSADGTLNYENFSGIPTVSVGQVENGTGEWNKVLVTPFNVTATSCSLRVTNVASTTITMTGTWHFTVVGPK